jgi:hypothetical protein
VNTFTTQDSPPSSSVMDKKIIKYCNEALLDSSLHLQFGILYTQVLNVHFKLWELLITSVVDTGVKFIAGVIDTLVANLPTVSLRLW